MKTIMSVAGARPNFIKIAAISDAIKSFNNSLGKKFFNHNIIHTGQHYDYNMSKGFFNELEIPKPDINLGVGSGSHARQTAEIMIRFEKVLIDFPPDYLLVVGDVNSTIACTLVASKMVDSFTDTTRRPIIIHVEAGLRSFDRSMPEEINRILTDQLSDILFVTEESGIENLLKEGVKKKKIFFVGNVMIDTLIRNLEKSKKSKIIKDMNIDNSYALMTLHRPSNVDDKDTLIRIIECIEKISTHIIIVFPVHPRTEEKLRKFSLFNRMINNKNILITQPLVYLDFLKLLSNSKLVITDSGGLQEETTYLKIPCLTMRNNTERPVTITEGSNLLVGDDLDLMIWETLNILDNKWKDCKIPNLWDGRASERIIDTLSKV